MRQGSMTLPHCQATADKIRAPEERRDTKPLRIWPVIMTHRKPGHRYFGHVSLTLTHQVTEARRASVQCKVQPFESSE